MQCGQTQLPSFPRPLIRSIESDAIHKSLLFRIAIDFSIAQVEITPKFHPFPFANTTCDARRSREQIGLEVPLLARAQFKIKQSHQRSHRLVHLHQPQIHPDTLAAPSPKGQVAVIVHTHPLRKLRLRLPTHFVAEEALRPKYLCVGAPDGLVAVHDVRSETNHRALGHELPVWECEPPSGHDALLGEHFAWDEAEGLADDGFEVRDGACLRVGGRELEGLGLGKGRCEDGFLEFGPHAGVLEG